MKELKLFEFNMSKLSFDERVPYLLKIFSLSGQDPQSLIDRNNLKNPKYDVISFGLRNYNVEILGPYHDISSFYNFSLPKTVRPFLIEFFDGIKGLSENEKVEYIPTCDNFKWQRLLEHMTAERIINEEMLNVKQIIALYSTLAEYIFGIKTPRAEIIEQNMSSAKKRMDKSGFVFIPESYFYQASTSHELMFNATEYAILKHENLLTEGCFLHLENEYLDDILERAYKKALHMAMVKIYENVPIKFRE